MVALYPVNRDIITHRVKTISCWDCDRMIGLFDLFESSTKQCWLVDSIKSLVPFQDDINIKDKTFAGLIIT